MNEPEDAATPVLRAYHSATSTPLWRALALSVLAHLAFLLPFFPTAIQFVKAPSLPPHAKVVKIFMPEQARPEIRPSNIAMSPVDTARYTTAGALAPSEKLPVDLNAIELSFAEDVSSQLPEVIRQQRGVLALIDKTDPTIARYLFEPPAWLVHTGIIDISDKVRFAMYPPEKWAAVSALAAEHGLQLDQFEVSALFDADYTICLRDAISVRAAAEPGLAGRQVKAARLAFSAESPCGIDVLEVSFAVNH